MSNKHTPGPWAKIQAIDITAADIRTVSGTTVATAYGHDLETTKANTALIASSPDLLAALEQIAEACELIKEDVGHKDPFRDGWGQAHAKLGAFARAAIAKAKGVRHD